MTPQVIINQLVQHVDEGPIYAQDSMSISPEIAQDLRAYHGADVPTCFVSPRSKLAKLLKNIASTVTDQWNGMIAMRALGLWLGGETVETIRQECVSTNNQITIDPIEAMLVFPLVAAAYPQLVADEIGSIQVFDRPDGKVFYLAAGSIPGTCLVQLGLYSKTLTCSEELLYASLGRDVEEPEQTSVRTVEELLTRVGPMAREVALQINGGIVNRVSESASSSVNYGTEYPNGHTVESWSVELVNHLRAMSNNVFARCFGDGTHLLVGHEAWDYLQPHVLPLQVNQLRNADLFAGLTLCATSLQDGTPFRIYRTRLMKDARKIVMVRRGQQWSEVSFVWSPCMARTSGEVRTPGIPVVRSPAYICHASEVVNPSFICSLTVQPNIVGSPLN